MEMKVNVAIFLWKYENHIATRALVSNFPAVTYAKAVKTTVTEAGGC